MSGSSNFPGGGSRPLCFVSRSFGVRGRGSLDEFLLSCWVVRALELIMYMHSYINVSKLDESSQVDFLSQRIPCSTFLTVRIKRSHAPPMWLAYGTLKLKVLWWDSRNFFSSCVDSTSNRFWSSLSAPTKFVSMSIEHFYWCPDSQEVPHSIDEAVSGEIDQDFEMDSPTCHACKYQAIPLQLFPVVLDHERAKNIQSSVSERGRRLHPRWGEICHFLAGQGVAGDCYSFV